MVSERCPECARVFEVPGEYERAVTRQIALQLEGRSALCYPTGQYRLRSMNPQQTTTLCEWTCLACNWSWWQGI